MNIALALVALLPGGAELQTLLLAAGLQARGHKVTLYATDPARHEAMVQAYAPTVPVRVGRRVSWSSRVTHLLQIAQWKAWLVRDRIQAAVGVLGLPHGILTAAAMGTSVKVYGRRSCVWSECRPYGTYAKHLPRLQRWVTRWGWRTTAMVCNTRAVQTSAMDEEGWPLQKLPLIPNGWPHLREVDHTSTVPYYLAGNRPEKAVDLACRQFAHRGVPLAIDHGMPYWEVIGILAHCARADAMSNAVGMAMAHAIPVVAFDLPGNVDLLEHCVRRWHYGNMADAVRHLREDICLRRRIGRDLQARVRERFSLAAMVDQWETLLTTEG